MEKQKMTKPRASEVVKARKLAIEAVLPSKVSIMGRTFDVKVMNLKGCAGDCTVADSLIRIHQAQSVESAKATLWHEAIHAALGISGLTELLEAKNDSLEEAIVRCIEHAFADVVNVDKLSISDKNSLTISAE